MKNKKEKAKKESNMEEKSTEKFRKVIKQIKREHGYTEKTGKELTSLISDGGWLYGILCFPVIPPISNKIINLHEISGDYATIEYKSPAGRFIPLYTGKDYSENLASVTKIPNYEYACCRAITVQSAIDKARECGIKGLIINPHIEGITICIQNENEQQSN